MRTKTVMTASAENLDPEEILKAAMTFRVQIKVLYQYWLAGEYVSCIGYSIPQ